MQNSSTDIKVSIIIPVFNPPLIQFNKCINTCLNQTLKNIEIILVNDASNTEITDLLNGIANNNYNCSVIHRNENGKAGMARNNGLDVSKGEYILFIDADDYIDLSFCEKMYYLAKTSNADIVACSWIIRSLDDKAIGRVGFQNKIYDLKDQSGQISAFLKMNNALWNKVFKRSIINDLRFKRFEVNLGEDRIFNVEYFCRSDKMLTCNFEGYNYIIHDKSSTRSNSEMNYLKVMLEMELHVLNSLDSANHHILHKKFHSLLLLKCYTSGCMWIAKETSSSNKQQLWSYWRSIFLTEIRPRLDGNRIIVFIYNLLITFDNPKLIGTITWYIMTFYLRFISFKYSISRGVIKIKL